MGPCQGRLCQLASIRLMAKATQTAESAIGTTTARPPWTPVELGVLAGRNHEPTKRTPLHFRHEQAGATMMWTGAWRRPFDYGDVAAEARAVHDGLGIIDLSTLGKILVEGPDAGALLDRLYPNRFSDLAVGRLRYGVLTTDGGRIIDDGTVTRLDDDLDRRRLRVRMGRMVERGLGLRRGDRQRHRRAGRRERRRAGRA